jgi:hypothetical protein
MSKGYFLTAKAFTGQAAVVRRGCFSLGSLGYVGRQNYSNGCSGKE